MELKRHCIGLLRTSSQRWDSRGHWTMFLSATSRVGVIHQSLWTLSPERSLIREASPILWQPSSSDEWITLPINGTLLPRRWCISSAQNGAQLYLHHSQILWQVTASLFLGVGNQAILTRMNMFKSSTGKRLTSMSPFTSFLHPL